MKINIKFLIALSLMTYSQCAVIEDDVETTSSTSSGSYSFLSLSDLEEIETLPYNFILAKNEIDSIYQIESVKIDLPELLGHSKTDYGYLSLINSINMLNHLKSESNYISYFEKKIYKLIYTTLLNRLKSKVIDFIHDILLISLMRSDNNSDPKKNSSFILSETKLSRQRVKFYPKSIDLTYDYHRIIEKVAEQITDFLYPDILMLSKYSLIKTDKIIEYIKIEINKLNTDKSTKEYLSNSIVISSYFKDLGPISLKIKDNSIIDRIRKIEFPIRDSIKENWTSYIKGSFLTSKELEFLASEYFDHYNTPIIIFDKIPNEMDYDNIRSKINGYLNTYKIVIYFHEDRWISCIIKQGISKNYYFVCDPLNIYIGDIEFIKVLKKILEPYNND